MSRGDLLDQLRQLLGTHPPQGADINMPESLRFPDQASPGADLLPLTQATAQGSTLMVDESGHANTLIQPTALASKHTSAFGVLKQKG
jgi:hypothetical protein